MLHSFYISDARNNITGVQRHRIPGGYNNNIPYVWNATIPGQAAPISEPIAAKLP